MVDKPEASKWEEKIRTAVEASVQIKTKTFPAQTERLIQMADLICESFKSGGTLYLCGNGGSAADAQHLAAELLVRLRPTVNRAAMPALALATDMSTVTACGNDYSFEQIFSRPLEGLGHPGDVLLAISTSGNSLNILEALSQAKRMGIRRFGLLGGEGGKALELCEIALVVPTTVTARIQEVHIMSGHILMEIIEEQMLELGKANENGKKSL